MSDTARLDHALKRLSAALDLCEAAAGRLDRAADEKRDLLDTLAVMGDDRDRLAGDLDDAQNRARALETAGAEVALRLSRAGGTLRHLLSEGE